MFVTAVRLQTSTPHDLIHPNKAARCLGRRFLLALPELLGAQGLVVSFVEQTADRIRKLIPQVLTNKLLLKAVSLARCLE